MMLVHVHDEASMRLKSFAPEAGCLGGLSRHVLFRGALSKIFNQAVYVYVGDKCFELFTELVPVAKKDAATIATALIQQLEEVAAFLPQRSDGSPPRLVHPITGDGIFTNEWPRA